MKQVILGFLFLLAGCSADLPKKVIGRWKIEKAWATKPEKHFPAAQFVTFMAEKGYQMYMDGKRTGHISTTGDTIKDFPYEFRKDSLIVHTKGLDLHYGVQFKTADTLLTTDKTGLVIKYSRVKAGK